MQVHNRDLAKRIHARANCRVHVHTCMMRALSFTVVGPCMMVMMISTSSAFTASSTKTTITSQFPTNTSSSSSSSLFAEKPQSQSQSQNRRETIHGILGAAAASAFMFTNAHVQTANALVEGNPVPPKKGAGTTKALSEEYRQGTSALADMDANAAVPESAYKKLPSGTIYADLREGKGDVEITDGSRVNLQWVLRKSNGYFVDSSEVQNGVPFIFTVGDKTAIDGLDEGIRGMRQGGTRRLLIPPSLAYVKGLEDGLPGPLPAGYGPRQQMRRVQNIRKDVPGEYVFLEVQITRVR